MNTTTKIKQKQSSSMANVFKLVMGTVIAQALGIIVMPILTRLYGPDAFGSAALFTSIVALISGIACMCYERAILLPKEDKEAVNLLGVSLVMLTLVTALSFFIIFIGKIFLSNWLISTGISPYIWLVPVGVFFAGLFLSLNYWNTRTKHFGRLAVSRVASSVTSIGFKLGGGATGYATAGSLVIGDILGSIVSNLSLAVRIWKGNKKIILAHINLEDMIKGLKRHKKFPLFLSWSMLINSISVQLPIFFLAIFFSPSVVGQYALGYRLLQIPMNLVGDAVRQVFSQRAAVTNLERKLNILVENTFKRLFFITIFPTLLLSLLGKEIFILFFGPNWAEAGLYTQILSFWTFFVFIGSPISSLNSIIERQEVSLLFNILFISTRFISIMIGGAMKSIYIALVLYSLSGVLVWSGLCYWYLHLSGVSMRKVIFDIFKGMFPALSLFLAVLLVKIIFQHNIPIVVCAGLLSTVIYYIFLLKKDRALKEEVLSYVSKIKVIKNRDTEA